MGKKGHVLNTGARFTHAKVAPLQPIDIDPGDFLLQVAQLLHVVSAPSARPAGSGFAGATTLDQARHQLANDVRAERDLTAIAEECGLS